MYSKFSVGVPSLCLVFVVFVFVLARTRVCLGGSLAVGHVLICFHFEFPQLICTIWTEAVT